MNIKNVAIFFGGDSSERNISLKSGYSVFRVLLNLNFYVTPIDTKYFNFDFFIRKKIDKVFIALHGGKGEDGSIQGFLDFLNIPYTGNNVFTCSLTINKYQTKEFLSNYGINIIPHLLIDKDEFYKNKKIDDSFYLNILKKFNNKILLKPNSHGSSIGVSFINNLYDFKINLFKKINIFSKILLEKYISGNEYTVGVINGEVLSPIKIIFKNKVFDYNFKYNNSEVFYDFNIDLFIKNRLKDISLKIWNLLFCKGCIRIDYIIDKNNNIWFLEVNSIPGMTKTSLISLAAKFSGIKYSDLIKRILFS